MSLIILKNNPKTKRTVPSGSGFLNVAEFFCDTIQGEGIHIGHPAAFLRLQNCTLNCNWCFGVRPGRRIPRITTLNGNNKKLHKVIKGDVVLTFDENTQKLVETTVTNVLNREVTEWHEIQTENHLYFVTPEHPFFTVNKGLVRADQLLPNDEILHSSSTQKMSYRMKKKNPMYNKKTVEKNKNNTDWKDLGIKIKENIRKKKKEGTYESSINILKKQDPEKYASYITKISDSKKGEKNPNWKGGSITPNYDALKKRIQNGIGVCSICENENKLEIHHIDENKENDAQVNLTCICHQCHSKIHKRGFNFWNGKRTDNKVSTTRAEQAQNGIKVITNKKVDITKDKYYGKSYGPKSLKVYNISCAPYNTYLIDDMWVHNCDTTRIWKEGNPYTYSELLTMMSHHHIDLIDKLKDGQHLVLTGGSPLRQQNELMGFIHAFIHVYGFKPYIEVENECVLSPIVGFADLVDCWNNSPKLINSGNRNRNYELLKTMSGLDNSWFKFVISGPDDWKEINTTYIIPGYIRKDQVILMPRGENMRELRFNRTLVVNLAIKNNVRYSTREHVVLWDTKVGV